ncbi:hypothetical protein [uncultured Oscillibacter sp.]|uniref:hypothetical protein n=1 Tax=uncultured Oscillibacter sp. TaxID=876091 RepID=UPI0025D4197A|nr:hypothetical protein [uncultured Oscillibacter sp.]
MYSRLSRGVNRLEYGYCDSGDECVTVHFANGCHKSVNTTGDSLQFRHICPGPV